MSQVFALEWNLNASQRKWKKLYSMKRSQLYAASAQPFTVIHWSMPCTISASLYRVSPDIPILPKIKAFSPFCSKIKCHSALSSKKIGLVWISPPMFAWFIICKDLVIIVHTSLLDLSKWIRVSSKLVLLFVADNLQFLFLSNTWEGLSEGFTFVKKCCS